MDRTAVEKMKILGGHWMLRQTRGVLLLFIHSGLLKVQRNYLESLMLYDDAIMHVMNR